MADTEFEEFCKDFDKLPRQIQTNVPFYSLVPDFVLDGDELTSSKSTTSDSTSSPTSEDDVTLEERGKRNFDDSGANKPSAVVDVLQSSPQHNPQQQQAARRRRKLPEIPKNKKSSLLHLLTNPQHHSPAALSICEELRNNRNSQTSMVPFSSTAKSGSLLALQCSYLLEEDSSPETEKLFSFCDVDSGCADSGHSTTHSPNDFKSLSPTTGQSASPFPAPYGGIPYSKLEMLEATHRGLHKFVPRHVDEIEVEIGDPIYVQKEADDLWCEGINLRTGRQGIFPSAYAVDLDYNDFDPNTEKIKKERYLLGYLGSVETLAHKGTAVVCQAVKKILGTANIQDVEAQSPKAQPCIIEISDLGLRMVDRSRNKKDKRPCMDYFYSLKNVSFCAFHPRDHRYIGFITKHPTVQRFACHVFVGTESTRPVAEAVGRAFQRFYQQFIETAYPIEDIYIE